MAVVDLHSSSDSSFEDQPMKEFNFSSSPSLSQDSSTASESDLGAADDDYIGELTRQMAHYMLQDFDVDPSCNTQPIQEEADDMKQHEHQIPPVSEFQKKQALIDEQIRSVQLNRLRQERQRKRQQEQGLAKQSNGNKKGRGNRGKNRASVNGLPPPVNNNDNNKKVQKTWWSQQQSIRTSRSGSPEVMRAVFLGDSGKPSTTGTGVFLPRVVGSGTTPIASAESRNKSGCSTVLIPARVVQALKLHFDKIGTVASPINPSPAAGAAVTMPLQHDAVTGDVKYAFQLQGQKGQSPSKPAVNQHPRNLRHHYQDMGLPQEWTY